MKLKATVTSDSDSNKKYSYSSEDLSILDCYVINPLAEKVVKKFPWWLPANIITIVSSALVFLASVIAITVKSTNWPTLSEMPLMDFRQDVQKQVHPLENSVIISLILSLRGKCCS